MLWACCTLPATAPGAAQVVAEPGRRITKNIAFAATPGNPRQTLDLYLPADNSGKSALLVFIHGGFWLLTDDDYRIGASLAENLVREGVAVALVRYRLAPAHRHPAQAEDVAAALAHLVKNADTYGLDEKRVFVSGHSAGGHLASLVALDRTYLAAQKISLRIAGVISFSGLYNLRPTWKISDNQKSAVGETFGYVPATLESASPITHVRGDALPFLVLTASADFPGFGIDARRFSDRLRGAGSTRVDQHMFKGADHFTLIKLDGENNPVRRTLLGFMGVKPFPAQLSAIIEGKRRWVDPPYSTVMFWKHFETDSLLPH